MLLLPCRGQQYTSIWFGRRFEGADGADCASGIAVLADRQKLVGLVAWMPTEWRVLDRIDAAHLEGFGSRGPDAQGGLGLGPGAGPDLSGEQVIDLDATVTTAHREGECGPDVAGDVWG